MIIIYIFLILFSGNNKTQRLVEIPIGQQSEVYKLDKLKITIVDANDKYVRAILSDDEIEKVKRLGYRTEIIYEDYTQIAKSQIEKFGYHSYEEVINEMLTVAGNYPNITFLDTIGYSVEGRLILGLKVSDNANVHEFEPGIRFTGCHHGNEHIATEIVLYLLHWLTDNYSTDPLARELVDNQEIWLIPMVNPDGVYHSTRHNVNGVDPNRDYGYMWEGAGNSPSPFSQPETQAMRNNALENKFVLGFDYHSAGAGSDIKWINTLWDYSSVYTQDDSLIMDIGGEYKDSTGYTLIRGWYWYSINGSCQDAMYGCEGMLDYTIETPEPLDSPTPVCEHNLGAMLRMIERAGGVGIAGIISDSITGEPLNARITIGCQDTNFWPIYTEQKLGDYHRVLLSGTYGIKVEANGYKTKVISDIAVSDSVVREDVVLVSNDKYYAHRIVWTYVPNPNDSCNNGTLSFDALGAPDSVFFSIGDSGALVIDMDNYMIDSFTIYEGNDGIADEGYEVLVSNTWNGTFVSLGTHYGTENFTLSETVRYVKIMDDGNGNPDALYAGFDLDAIEVFSILGSEGIVDNPYLMVLHQNTPNPFIGKTNIQFKVGAISRLRFADRGLKLQVYDLTGPLVKTLFDSEIPNLNSWFSVTWDGKDNKGKKMSAGIYFYRLKVGDYSITKKLTFLSS